MSVGRIIYYHRKKQHLTQEQLCQGICSITHLSKIENNFKEAHTTTLELLCNKLNISIEKEGNKIEMLRKKLDLLYDTIERVYEEKAISIYNELLEEEEYVQYTELVYVYKLYLLRYLLFVGEIKEYEKNASSMKTDVAKYSSYERYIWELLEAIYLGRKGQFAQSLHILKGIEDKAEKYNDRITEYYYYRASIHGHLYQSSLSIFYANKALRIYENKTNLLRIIYTKMYIAVHLVRLREFDTAEQMLFLIQNDCDLLGNNDMQAIIYHNLGYLHYEQANFKLARDYYEKTLQLKNINQVYYYETIVAWAKSLIQMNQATEAIKRLKEEMNKMADRSSPLYVHLNIVYLEGIANEEALIKYIIDSGIQVVEYNMELTEALRYLEMIISHFEKKEEYKNANYYLQKSNQLLKRCSIY